MLLNKVKRSKLARVCLRKCLAQAHARVARASSLREFFARYSHSAHSRVYLRVYTNMCIDSVAYSDGAHISLARAASEIDLLARALCELTYVYLYR